MKDIPIVQSKPLIFGISDIIISDDEKKFFSVNPVFGFILFKRNIESAPQLYNLIADLRSIYSNRKIYIFIDQEGGRVARLKPPLTSQEYPTGEYFSKLYEEDSLKACQAVHNNYFKLALDMRFYDIDSPCAPVADLSFSNADSVIGDRSFGNDPRKVIELTKAAVEGLTKAGCIPVIKHIPGHGRADCDSHLELPIIKTPIAELEKTDFAVFKELSKLENVNFAMTAHIAFEALDPGKAVTISAKAIKYIREKVGFTNQIMTDDLSMLALHGKVGKNYQLLTKAIRFIKDPVKDQAPYDLDNLRGIENFDQKIWHLTEDKQINYLTKLLEDFKQQYLESLESVTKQSVEAGCDLILHCSGDLEEMKVIAKVFDNNLEN